MTHYLSLLHQILVTFVHAHASEIAVVLACYAAVSLLNLFVGRRTQIEAWVARHPAWALALRLLRGAGCDPWILAKGAREFVAHEAIARGPALLRLLRAALRAAFRLPVVLVVALPLLTGCAWWTAHKSEVIDAAQLACELALTAKPEVVDEAKRRSLTGQQWAEALCELPDILEPFLLEQNRAVAAPQACAVAREKGLVR